MVDSVQSRLEGRSARLAWGCEGCEYCDGGVYWNVYRDGPFTPDWQSDTLSVIYRYTSNRPELLPMPDVGTFIHLDSDGYERMPDGSWGLKGHMFVQTRFP